MMQTFHVAFHFIGNRNRYTEKGSIDTTRERERENKYDTNPLEVQHKKYIKKRHENVRKEKYKVDHFESQRFKGTSIRFKNSFFQNYQPFF